MFCQIRYETDVSHTVAVTWPDGTQERFDLTPADGSTFFRPATAAAFTAQRGTTSTLEPVGSTSLTYLDDGNLYGGGFGVDGIYDPKRFRLTDRFGTVYLLDRDQGLLSTTDRRGVEISFSDDGITSSTEDLATFVRDDRGRIVEIVGPDNATLTYTYDAAGDLVEVRNARGNTTTYLLRPPPDRHRRARRTAVVDPDLQRQRPTHRRHRCCRQHHRGLHRRR